MDRPVVLNWPQDTTVFDIADTMGVKVFTGIPDKYTVSESTMDAFISMLGESVPARES